MQCWIWQFREKKNVLLTALRLCSDTATPSTENLWMVFSMQGFIYTTRNSHICIYLHDFFAQGGLLEKYTIRQRQVINTQCWNRVFLTFTKTPTDKVFFINKHGKDKIYITNINSLRPSPAQKKYTLCPTNDAAYARLLYHTSARFLCIRRIHREVVLFGKVSNTQRWNCVVRIFIKTYSPKD